MGNERIILETPISLELISHAENITIDQKELTYWKAMLTIPENIGFLSVKPLDDGGYLYTGAAEKLVALKELGIKELLCNIITETPTEVSADNTIAKAKGTRLNAAQRFQVMEFLKTNKDKVVGFQRLQEVAEYVLKELKVVVSAQTAGNYLEMLGLPKPGGSIESARITALEGVITQLSNRISDLAGNWLLLQNEIVQIKKNSIQQVDVINSQQAAIEELQNKIPNDLSDRLRDVEGYVESLRNAASEAADR